MITFFLYCGISFLIVHCRSIDSEGYTNDSPKFYPQREKAHHKVGSDVLLRCNGPHYDHTNFTWEFKPCASNYNGIRCDEDNLEVIDEKDAEWKKLDFSKGKKRLILKNTSEENSGVYRCLYNDSIVKIYFLDVMAHTKPYEGPPPRIMSVTASNSTILPNMDVVIQCKASSQTAPTIRWLKECGGKRCDVPEDGRCYCTIQSTNPSHEIEDNLYLSKLIIHKVRPVDGGTYACLAMSLYGKDYKNVTIKVPHAKGREIPKSFSLLFLIPLSFVLVPCSIWLCYYCCYKRRKERARRARGQNQRLIVPVVHVNVVVEDNKQ